MKIVCLDTGTFYWNEDLDLSSLRAFGICVLHHRTVKEEIESRITDAEVVITNKVILDKNNFESMPYVRFIQTASTGFNHVDIQAAKEKAKGDIFSTQIASDSRERIDSEQRDMRRQLSLIDSRIKAEKNDIARGELLLQKESLVHKMMIDAEPEIGLDEEGKKMSEVLMNDQYGKIQGAEG